MQASIPALALAAFFLSAGAVAATRTVTLNVSNMTCVTCPLTLKAALKKVPGVGNIQVSFETRQAVVTFDDARTSIATLKKATADAGFPATVKK